MKVATISRGWPSRDVAVLDDGQLAECYAVNDRSRQSVRVNFVASIDGAATDHGLSGGLSGQADKRVFDMLRRLSDVLLVGAGTVRAEGYGAMQLDQASVRLRRDASSLSRIRASVSRFRQTSRWCLRTFSSASNANENFFTISLPRWR